jgi:opacity protein-like surface antigen
VKLQQFRRALFIQTRDGLGVITSRMGTTMKKVLLVTASLIAISATAPALAADLAARPYTKAPPMVAAIYDWSGFYVGVNGGWGSSRNSWDSVSPFLVGAEGSHDATGGVAGGQIGYRWQSGTWVLGLEAQGDWADLSGSNIGTPSGPRQPRRSMAWACSPVRSAGPPTTCCSRQGRCGCDLEQVQHQQRRWRAVCEHR